MANPTAITDRLTVTVAEVKQWLGATTTDATRDAILAALIPVATGMADAYCNNNFLDDDGEDADIPAPVKTGVLELISELYSQHMLRTGKPAQTGRVTSQSAGDLSVSFAAPADATMPALVANILGMYRLMPGEEEAPDAIRETDLSSMSQ